MRILKIKNAEYIGGHKIKIDFSDGARNIVDFGPFLKNASHPEIRKFLDIKKFKLFTVSKGDLMWGDFELIFPIADLYRNTIDHRNPESMANDYPVKAHRAARG